MREKTVSPDLYIPIERASASRPIQRGVEFSIDDEKLRGEFIFPDVVRLSISSRGVFNARSTGAVIQDDPEPVRFRFRETPDTFVLESDALRVMIGRAPFSIEIIRSDGTPVMRSAPGRAYSRLNGMWSVSRMKTPNDRFLGFGEKTGPMNKNGRLLRFRNTDIMQVAPMDEALDPDFDPYYVSIPFHMHVPAGTTAVSGSFIDTTWPLTADLRNSDTATFVGDGGSYVEYFFAGPDMRALLDRYTALTGRPALPPLWALGHHLCRWDDFNEGVIRRIADACRAHGIPCDSVWLDIDHMDGFRIFTWDKAKFPDPAGFAAELQGKGFRLVAILDPGVKMDPGYHVYDEGARRRLFCTAPDGSVFAGKVWPGRTVFPDFTRADVRVWWSSLVARHVPGVFDGLWIDMNEPAFTGAEDSRMLFGSPDAPEPHDAWRNRYAILMAEATRSGLLDARPNERPFVLSRAGSPGIQRFAANWTGDNGSRWDHLAMSVRMSCGLGMSGQPFVGSDIGGFAKDATAELLVRWYQYAAFQPFCRNHSMKETALQWPWSFGKRALGLIRNALELRYRLLPYLYTAFVRSSETGEPVQRPLAFDFPDDPRAWETEDEFMCGPDILVAPVLRPRARSRRVYLPEGADWYILDTPACFPGGSTVTMNTPLSVCPVFVRAGAAVPMGPPAGSTMGHAPQELTLSVYLPLRDGVWTGTLDEDDGVSVRGTAGAFIRTRLRTERTGGRIALSATVSGGGFPEFKRETFRIRMCGRTVTEHVIMNRGTDFSLNFSDDGLPGTEAVD